MLGELIGAPVFSRLFVGFLLYVVAERLRREMHYPGMWALTLVPLTLLARDLVSVYVAGELVFIASDIAIIGIYLAWLSRYTRLAALLAAYSAGAVALIALDVVGRVLGWPAYIVLVVELALPVGAFTLFTIAIVDIRELYVPQSSPIVRARYPLLTFLGAALVIGLVQDYSHDVVLRLLLPATYFGHFYVLRAYQFQREADLGRQIRLRERYLDTLFDFMKRTRMAVEEHAPTESVLDYVVTTVAESVHGESGAALLVGDDGLLHVKATYGFFPPPYKIPASTKTKVGAVEKYFRARAIQVGETVLGETVQRGRPMFVQRCDADPRLAESVGDKVGYMSSLIVVPLVIDGRSTGVVAVAHRQEDRIFSQEDFSHATVLAEYASLTLENLFNYMEILEKKQIEKEISMAADIQRGMLPTGVPELGGVGIGSFTSAARGVSGDYYDYFTMEQSGRIALTVCDVAGKGVPASLVMVMIRTIMHLLSSSFMDAATMTAWINRGVTGSVDLGRFATFSIVAYDPQTRTLEYSNAGHLPIMLYRSSTESIESLHCEGLPIGIEREATYETKRYSLAAGDLLIMYTDGIVEAKSHDRAEYGWERLEDVVSEHRHEEAQEIVDAVAASVDRFTDGEAQFDDQTLLVMKVG